MKQYEECELPGNYEKAFMKSLEEIGQESLILFFKSKEMHYGGPISRSALDFNKDSIFWELSEIVQKIYAITESRNLWQNILRNEMREDQEMVLSVLKECSNLRIPKIFRACVLLLYFDLCHGIKL